MASKFIFIISSYTVSKLARFLNTVYVKTNTIYTFLENVNYIIFHTGTVL